MALQTSGAISLNDIHVEAGGSTNTTCSLNDSDIRGLTAASGFTINSTLGTNIDFGDFYGASSITTPTSYGKTGITPGAFAAFTIDNYLYTNTKYDSTYTSLITSSNGVNAIHNDDSSFVDPAGNTQELVNIYFGTTKGGVNAGAFLYISLLGSSVSSNFQFSSSALGVTNATPNSSFTDGNGVGFSYIQSSNQNVTNASGTGYTLTLFQWRRTDNTGSPGLGGLTMTSARLTNLDFTVT